MCCSGMLLTIKQKHVPLEVKILILSSNEEFIETLTFSLRSLIFTETPVACGCSTEIMTGSHGVDYLI